MDRRFCVLGNRPFLPTLSSLTGRKAPPSEDLELFRVLSRPLIWGCNGRYSLILRSLFFSLNETQGINILLLFIGMRYLSIFRSAVSGALPIDDSCRRRFVKSQVWIDHEIHSRATVGSPPRQRHHHYTNFIISTKGEKHFTITCACLRSREQTMMMNKRNTMRPLFFLLGLFSACLASRRPIAQRPSNLLEKDTFLAFHIMWSRTFPYFLCYDDKRVAFGDLAVRGDQAGIFPTFTYEWRKNIVFWGHHSPATS